MKRLPTAFVRIVPRSVVTAPFKAADTVLEKAPVVGSMYQGAKDLAQKAAAKVLAKEWPEG